MGRPFFQAREDIWNTVFTLVFLLLFLWFATWIDSRTGLGVRIEPFDFFLISLATFRFIRLVTYDKLTDFVRAYFLSGDTPLYRTVYELLVCPWCTSIWASLIMVTIFFVFPFGWLFTFVLAVSWLASVIQVSVSSIIRSSEKSALEKRIIEEERRFR